MDSSRNAAQGATGPSSGVGDSNSNLDWRSQLQPDARRKVLNKIMDTLKRHLTVPVSEGLSELQRAAVRFEEKIYTTATSQPDYFRKIAQKMTHPRLNPPLPKQIGNDPGVGMMSQQPGTKPGQSLVTPQAMNLPSASRQQQQQPLFRGLPNIAKAGPGGTSGANSPPILVPSISNGNLTSGPGETSGTSGLESQNQMLYDQQKLKSCHKLQPQQKQTQMQMCSALAGGSGMMSTAPTGGIQQSQLNLVQQQTAGQRGLFQQRPLMRQQQQQPQPTMQNRIMPTHQTKNMNDLQKLQFQMQQNQMQQSQRQQNRLRQNQLQLNQQMMLNQHQNQFLGSGNAGNMKNMQRQNQMQRQAGLLQQQPPQKQQHLPSQLQSQQQQLLQQQLQPEQQHLSMMQQREMQMPQQWVQGSPGPLQMQNNNANGPQRQQQQQLIPQQQQQQLIPQQQQQQQQKVFQDVASSAQAGHPEDWQEEMYQKIKYLKDTYFTDLKELYQKLSFKLSQPQSIVQTNAGGGERIKKLKQFKMVLESMMAVLLLGKHDMQIGLKDKLSGYEKLILVILQNRRKASQKKPQAGAPADQPHFPLQQLQPRLQSQQLPQQQQPQQIDDPPNRLQQQLSTSAMPQSNNWGMPNAMQRRMQNALQSDQLQASDMRFVSLQQGTMGPTMQNTMKPPQMISSGARIGSSNMSHTVTMAGMPMNAQVLKQQQQHQGQQILLQQSMIPTQQQMQQCHLQPCIIQQKQQLLQQQKQQQAQHNQMQQPGQPSESADLNFWQRAAGMKSGSMYPRHYPGMGQCNSYYHSQLKSGSNVPIFSVQNIQSSSPQTSHPSLNVDQQGLIPTTQLKSGTLLLAAASPFVPSLSPPVAPSPMIEDIELGAGLMHNSAVGQAGQPLPANTQTGQMGEPQTGLFSVGTPGISSVPLLAEFTSPETGPGTNLSTQDPVTEKPIDKLITSMMYCPLPPTKKMKRDISAMPLNGNNNDVLSPDSVSVAHNFKASGTDASVMQSTATSHTKGLKSKMHHALLEEIRNINTMLIDTELTLNEEDADWTAVAGESILVKCTYKAIAPSTYFTSSQLILTLSLRLVVPSGYPKCSPVILDRLSDERRFDTTITLQYPIYLAKAFKKIRDIDDFLTRARSNFNISIKSLPQPISLKEIAHTWDACARKAMQESSATVQGRELQHQSKL